MFMVDCIFEEYCSECTCNHACIVMGQSSYLLELNSILHNSSSRSMSAKDIDVLCKLYTDCAERQIGVVISKETLKLASDLTYISVCKTWEGSQYHSRTYRLSFSEYINKLQKSWSAGIDDSIEYMQIRADSAAVLIIYNIDYINFKDFHSETLLQLITRRQTKGLTTIIVSPKTTELIGSGQLFNRMVEVFNKNIVGSRD